jgi:hypothetical protein
MNQFQRAQNTLWSFGRVLRKMRGTTSLEELAARTGIEAPRLAYVESGRLTADEWLARLILRQGFELEKPDIDRLILGIELYDLGLRDNEVRQLLVDFISKTAPTHLGERLRELYRSYSS